MTGTSLPHCYVHSPFSSEARMQAAPVSTWVQVRRECVCPLGLQTTLKPKFV